MGELGVPMPTKEETDLQRLLDTAREMVQYEWPAATWLGVQMRLKHALNVWLLPRMTGVCS